MNMILVIRQFFPRDYVGLSLWPFIIVREKALLNDKVLLHHEKIHLKQQLEMMVIPFYFFYITEWLIRTMMYKDAYRAYQNISFEREAYHNEDNLNYAAKRKPFSFVKYLFF